MELLGKGNANFGKGKGKGKESFPKARKRNRKGTLSFSGSRKGKGTLSGKFWKVSTTGSQDSIRGSKLLKTPWSSPTPYTQPQTPLGCHYFDYFSIRIRLLDNGDWCGVVMTDDATSKEV